MQALSDTQVLAMELLSQGPLVRWQGGFWALADEPFKDRVGIGRVPDRHVGIQTLEALMKRDMAIRMTCDEPAYKKPITLTDAGRAWLQDHETASTPSP